MAYQPAVVSLQFPGGTMDEFVAVIREVQSKANIVLATAARDARVPAMVLKQAGLEQALEGACMAASADFEVRVKEFRGIGEPVYSITAYRLRRATQINKQTGKREAVGPDPDELVQRVHSLNDLTAKSPYGAEALDVRTILSAIDLAMSDERRQPRIRYHEDSGLLLVRGTHNQLQTVGELLGVLHEDVKQRERRAMNEQQLQRRGRKPGESADKDR